MPTAETDMHALIRDNFRLIYWLANKLAGEKADDVVQETCIKILTSNNPPRTSVSQWIRLQVLSARWRLWKRDRRHQSDELDEAVMGATQPNQEDAAELAMIADHARALPERQQQVLSRLMDGDDLREAGESMGVSKQRAHYLLQQARERLGLAA